MFVFLSKMTFPKRKTLVYGPTEKGGIATLFYNLDKGASDDDIDNKTVPWRKESVELWNLPGTNYLYTQNGLGEIPDPSVWDKTGNYIGELWPIGEILPTSHIENKELEEENIYLKNSIHAQKQEILKLERENRENTKILDTIEKNLIANHSTDSSHLGVAFAFGIILLSFLLNWVLKN